MSSRKNEIIQYVATEPLPGSPPEVFSSFVVLRQEALRDKLNHHLRVNKKPSYKGRLLNVLFDTLSGRFYCPDFDEQTVRSVFATTQNLQATKNQLDAEMAGLRSDYDKLVKMDDGLAKLQTDKFNQMLQGLISQKQAVSRQQADLEKNNVLGEDTYRTMMDAIKLRASKEYPNVSSLPPIAGDPLLYFRIKKTSDFPGAWQFIRRTFFQDEEPRDFVVIEANLNLMPSTKNSLAQFKDQKKSAAFVPSGPPVKFETQSVDNKGRLLYSQAPPFILINLGELPLGSADKERHLVTCYREAYTYLMGHDFTIGGFRGNDIYSAAFLLYVGWPYREICENFLEAAKSPQDFLDRAEAVYHAAQTLSKSGFTDLIKSPFYYQIVNAPPGAMARFGKMPVPMQKFFSIIAQDEPNRALAIRSSLYVPMSCWRMLFGLQQQPMVLRYEPQRNVVRAYFWDESAKGHAKNVMNQSRQYMVEKDGIPNNAQTQRSSPLEWTQVDGYTFDLRWVSEFPQAAYILQRSLKKLGDSEGRELPFEDIPVLTGPITAIPGYEDKLGGYTDPTFLPENLRDKPMTLIPGINLKPPFIFIDTIHKPSVAEQVGTIVHEYWHFIYFNVLKLTATGYQLPQGDPNSKEYLAGVMDYLTNPSEYRSHLQQMKYLLGTGMNVNEVAEHFIDMAKLQGTPTPNQVAIMRRYYEIATEAQRQMDESAMMNEDPRMTKPQHGFLRLEPPNNEEVV